jgi:hypothetical protein
MAFTWIGGIALILIACFSCKPISYFWHAVGPGGCMKSQPLWYTMASFQLATDIAVLILPIPVLVNLQLPRKQKLTLIFVFLLGGLYVLFPPTMPLY